MLRRDERLRKGLERLLTEEVFTPTLRAQMRAAIRAELGLMDEEYCVECRSPLKPSCIESKFETITYEILCDCGHSNIVFEYVIPPFVPSFEGAVVCATPMRPCVQAAIEAELKREITAQCHKCFAHLTAQVVDRDNDLARYRISCVCGKSQWEVELIVSDASPYLNRVDGVRFN